MRFYIVDCFAEKKYQGNELLVVLPDRPVSDEEQQLIAREINFSETAFILSGKQPNGGYDVRIWTPNSGEVPFAGHPTLGTAWVIRNYLENGENDLVKLNLKAGQIPVRMKEHGMTMSQNPPAFGDSVSRQEIAEVFSIDAEQIDENYPIQLVSTGLESVIIPLRSREALSKVKTDRAAFENYIAHHPKSYCNHLFFVPTAEKTISARCLMEDFNEDPATGSANGCLAAYLLKHNYFDSQEIAYTAIQGEDMGRTSVLKIYAALSEEKWTIEVGGNCFLTASGDWD